MTDQRQINHALEAFFEPGTDQLADRVLDAALLQIDHTQQRRRLPAFGRIFTMNTQLRLAAAAVIGVLAIGGAIFALNPEANVGSPTPSPAISPQPSPSIAASAFQITGSPATDRTVRGVTVALLDGRVLIAGGGATTSDTADLYDPATGTWSPTGSMHDKRSYPVAVRLNDGRVLVAGGNGASGSGQLDSVELYDAATGIWSTAAPMNDTREQAFAAVLADGRVLVGGGISGQSVLRKAEIFDPATGAWTPTGDLVAARAGPLSATLLTDGRLLITGGLTDDNRSAELYDPTAGTWSATGSLTGWRGDEQTSVLLADGRVLSVGGHREAGDGGVSTGELFDPLTGTWAPGGALAAPHIDVQVAVTLGDGRVLLVGASATLGESALAQLYDPATGTWSRVSILRGVKYVRSATVLPDGSVLVVGSSASMFDSAGGTPSAERLDPGSIR